MSHCLTGIQIVTSCSCFLNQFIYCFYKKIIVRSGKEIMKYTWTPSAIQDLLKKLTQAIAGLEEPMSLKIVHEYGKDPFLILISCLLSLRARDVVTYKVSKELFKYAKTPQELVAMPIAALEKIIRPIGTYKRKAHILHDVSEYLIKNHAGKVPSDEAELLAIRGVGRKTANLVRGIAFDIPSICVDVHVHRIANALGLVHTKTPEQTEVALKKIIPKKDWLKINHLLVVWGQNRAKMREMGFEF